MAWIWYCTYNKGWGVDRERCPGGSRKPLKTEQAAINGARKHANKPGYHFGNYSSHYGDVYVREVTPTGRGKKNGKCYRVRP